MDDQTDIALGWFSVGLLAGCVFCVIGMTVRQRCELEKHDIYTEVPNDPPV